VTALGTLIRKARREAGYKNAESLAVELGVGVRTVQRWEAGESQPSIAKLWKIATLTGKPLSFFLEEEAVA
jgi:transcriptional regulator with XRE-family HTH domain